MQNLIGSEPMVHLLHYYGEYIPYAERRSGLFIPSVVLILVSKVLKVLSEILTGSAQVPAL